jgi:hypothetical protein
LNKAQAGKKLNTRPEMGKEFFQVFGLAETHHFIKIQNKNNK